MKEVKNSAYLTQQLDQAINTYRSGLTVLVQIITVLILANVSILGYAINYKIAGLIYIGALFPLLTMYLIYLVSRLLTPAIYTAYHTEKLLGGGKGDSLMRTGISVLLSDEILTALDDIPEIEVRTERLERLRSLKLSLLGYRKRMVYLILSFLTLLQLIAPEFLAIFYDWPIFEPYFLGS